MAEQVENIDEELALLEAELEDTPAEITGTAAGSDEGQSVTEPSKEEVPSQHAAEDQAESDSAQVTDPFGPEITLAQPTPEDWPQDPVELALEPSKPAKKRQALVMQPNPAVKLAQTVKPSSTADGNKKSKLPAVQKSGVAKPSKSAAGDKAAKRQKEAKEAKLPRAQGAYTFFAADRRAAVKEANPEMGFGEISKELGSLWKGLTAAEKAPYEVKAAEDKERVTKLREDTNAQASKTANSKDSKPARAKTPYMLFCADKRESIKHDNPEAGFGDIAKLLAAAWQSTSANDKQVYSDRHEAEKAALAGQHDAKSTKPAANKPKKVYKRKAKPEEDKQLELSDSEPEPETAEDISMTAVDVKNDTVSQGSDADNQCAAVQPTHKRARPAVRAEKQAVRKQRPATAESDDEEERESCDWDEHTAEIIMEETAHGKYVVKRQGVGYSEYGLVDARAVKRQRGNAEAAKDIPVPVTLLEEYEVFVTRFRTAVHDHSDGSSLDLDVLEQESPLEMCYYLGKLMEPNFPLNKVADKRSDRLIKVPMLGLSFTVARLVAVERTRSVKEVDRLKVLNKELKDKLTQLEKASAINIAAEE